MLKGLKKKIVDDENKINKISEVQQMKDEPKKQDQKQPPFLQLNQKIWNSYIGGNIESTKSMIQELQKFEAIHFSKQEPQKEKKEEKFQYEMNFQEENEIKKLNKNRKKILKSLKSQKDCIFCPQNEKLNIVSSANHMYLCLPLRKTFKKYPHLWLVPIEHQQTMIGLDAQVLEEAKNYKKCLTQMYDQLGYHFVFFEQYWQENSHVFIECLGIPLKRAYDLPFYFKQNMQDVQGDWGTHKSIIQVNRDKPIEKKIPKRMKYFYIDFGLGYGYAHVIENQKFWKKQFCMEVIASALGMQKYETKTTEQYNDQEVNTKIEQFNRNWTKYDWTKLLDQ